jgi:hypothetical protein
VAALEQQIAQMRADEASAAGDQVSHRGQVAQDDGLG